VGGEQELGKGGRGGVEGDREREKGQSKREGSDAAETAGLHKRPRANVKVLSEHTHTLSFKSQK